MGLRARWGLCTGAGPRGLGTGSSQLPLSISPYRGPLHGPLGDFSRSAPMLNTPEGPTLPRGRQVSVQGLITLWLSGFVNPDTGVLTLPVGSPTEAELCAAWTRHPRPAHVVLEPLGCFLFPLPSCLGHFCSFRKHLSRCPLPNWSVLMLKCLEPEVLVENRCSVCDPKLQSVFPSIIELLFLLRSLCPSLVTF